MCLLPYHQPGKWKLAAVRADGADRHQAVQAEM
jgi:hypothetical protein